MVIKKGLTEQQEQGLLVGWLKMKRIKHYHCPNGGTRYIREAVMLKKQGVSAGVPDICLPIPNKKYHGLYVEMKRKQGGVVSLDQKNWIDYLNSQSYLAVVCKGFEAARSVIEEYLGDI